MDRRFLKLIPLCVLGAVLTSSGAVDLCQTPRYGVVDIGMLRGGFTAQVTGMNEAGQIVCVQIADLQDHTKSFLRAFAFYDDDDDDDMRNLGSLGGSTSAALAINDSARIVGYSSLADDPSSPRHAFLYDGTMHDLGTLKGGNSEAYAINNRGEIVGRSIDLFTHAFLYDGVMHDLGTLGGNYSEARAINDRGEVVGCSTNSASSNCHAFLLDAHGMHDLGTLGGRTSYARAINNHGIVVGAAQLPDGTYQAFLYDGSLHALGSIEGGPTYAESVNDNNEVVGRWFSASGEHAGAFLFEGGKLYDLKTLLSVGGSGWRSLIEASAIDQSGGIAGTGIMADGVHAFRLYPIQQDKPN